MSVGQLTVNVTVLVTVAPPLAVIMQDIVVNVPTVVVTKVNLLQAKDVSAEHPTYAIVEPEHTIEVMGQLESLVVKVLGISKF